MEATEAMLTCIVISRTPFVQGGVSELQGLLQDSSSSAILKERERTR